MSFITLKHLKLIFATILNRFVCRNSFKCYYYLYLKNKEVTKLTIEKSLVGNKIKEIRTEKGLTGKQLAEMADLSHGTISQIETGKNKYKIKAETLKKIAQSLGETPNEKAQYYHQLMYAAGYEVSEQEFLTTAMDSIKGNITNDFTVMISSDTGMLIGKEITQLYLNNKREDDTLNRLFLLLSHLNKYNQSNNQNERIELSLEIRKNLEHILLN